MTFGLSCSDMDYLNSDQNVAGLNSTDNVNTDLFATCAPKNTFMDGELGIQNCDQVVQFTSQGALLEVCKPQFQEVVCNNVTESVSANTNTTNTVSTSTNSILTQVADLKLVDAQTYQNEAEKTNKEMFQLNTIVPSLQVYPIQNVLTNTTNSSEVYVVSMTVDDDLEQKQVNMDITKSIQILDRDINLNDLTQIPDFKEPQRSSTPNFDETAIGIGNINDTIIDGHNLHDQVKQLNAGNAPPLLPLLEIKENPKGDTDKRQQIREDVDVKQKKQEDSTDEQKENVDVKQKKQEGITGKQKDNKPKEDTATKPSEDILAYRRKEEGLKWCNDKNGGKLEQNENMYKSHLQDFKKKPKTVADLLEANYGGTSRYCKEWLRKNEHDASGGGGPADCGGGTAGCGVIENNAQSDTYVEQDSCDSNLLHNITSVSQNVPQKKPRPKLCTAQVAKKIHGSKEQEKM